MRTSSAEQSGGALTQRETIEKWVTDRGDELVTIYADEGVMGGMEDLPKRKAIGLTLNVLALRDADGVVVAKLDRLARDLILQEHLLAEIHRAGGILLSCEPGEASLLGPGVDDPTRKLVRQVLGAVAEFDRAMIKYRAQAGYKRAQASGQHMGGNPPYGWRRVGRGKLEPDEREQEIIGEARTLREDFRLTYAEVAEFFLQAGMPPKLVTSRRHAPNTVRTILFNAEAKGIRRRPLSAVGRQFAGVLPDQRTVKPGRQAR